jgi:hypothetical protein
MTAAVFQSREQALAGGLTFVMHVLFLVLLVVAVMVVLHLHHRHLF